MKIQWIVDVRSPMGPQKPMGFHRFRGWSRAGLAPGPHKPDFHQIVWSSVDIMDFHKNAGDPWSYMIFMGFIPTLVFGVFFRFPVLQLYFTIFQSNATRIPSNCKEISFNTSIFIIFYFHNSSLKTLNQKIKQSY